ncbi:glycolate oxidase subunit GlcE [Nevskia soli]|uniref:glycolate oxidase subunit GlcE n=1 Tax=Nevskia soli TaxID=418856 RepID=UPI0004A764D1|nr:glycolate oxidase subunit GlcE [Nevskia soli]
MSEDVAALSERILAAAANGRALCIRGAGSKDFYGGPLQGEPLDTIGLRGIVDYEPTELVVTARAGTPLAELEAALAERGQVLPFEPPRFGGGTLGGAVAAGLSGPRRPYAGAARDFVLGLRLLDGQGRHLRFGGQVIKNVAGFDVSRLLTGSLGTLGLLTEVTLKTLPRPPAETSLRFELDEATALRRMNEWAARPLPLSASSYHDGALRLRLSGAEAAVREACGKLGGVAFSGGDYWDGLRDQHDAFFKSAATLWRVSLPQTAPPLRGDAPQLIEWGGALRWLAGSQDAVALRRQAAELGGHATLFRGADKSAGVFQPLPAALAQLHRRIKAVLDPAGIFNRGRLYPEF